MMNSDLILTPMWVYILAPLVGGGMAGLFGLYTLKKLENKEEEVEDKQ